MMLYQWQSQYIGNMYVFNMVDLKDEDEKFGDFKIAMIAENTEQINQEVSEALEKEIKKGKNQNPLHASGTCKKL